MSAQTVRLSNVDINKALENKDFEVLFQPIFDLGDGSLARMESFVRWRHASLGALPPGAFISFFESQGRMGELTRYVLAEALDQYRSWRGPYPPGVSINLALSDLTDEAFVTHFDKVLRDRDFPADLITLECPTPVVDADLEAAAANFQRLRETGARLAIEVRGRANDFLRTIDPFPFDEIKTGGSSILRFARTVRGPGLSAISDLLDVAVKANAVITAVGVEDQTALSALRGLGFTAAQGNHLGPVGSLNDFRPSRINEVRDLLDLPRLTPDNLAALFQTDRAGAAAPAEPSASDQPAPPPDEKAVDASAGTANDQPSEDDRRTAAKASPQTSAETPAWKADGAAKASPRIDGETRARAREKARRLALAKRARLREARKAAAIRQARSKAADQAETDGPQADEQPQKTPAPRPASRPDFPESAAPQALQQRLHKEFSEPAAAKSQAEPAANSPAKTQVKTQVKTQAKPLAKPLAQSADEQNAAPPAGPKPDEPRPQNAPAPGAAPAAAKQAEAPKPEAARAVSMKIAGAGAHFRPGMRVSGGIADAPHMAARPRAAAIPETLTGRQELRFRDNAQPPRATSPTAKTAARDPLKTRSAAPIQPEPAPEGPAPTPLDLGPDDREVMGDLHAEYEEAAKPARKPRRKSFLTRRYRLLPDHFWPKSWKRRFRRWRNDRMEPAELS